jgi:type IX secretion system PorP/SprF family membrane protein
VTKKQYFSYLVLRRVVVIMERKGLLRLVLLFVLFAGLTRLCGQNTPHYSLHMLDRYQMNPAYGGMESSLSITGNYRSQWLGIAGNPVQKYIDAHMPFYMWKGALGISVRHETIGAQRLLNATLSYNYVQDTDIGLFSVGFAAGITQQTLDGSLLRTPDGEYEGPTIIHNDPLLPNTVVHGIAPVFHAGIFYGGDRFEAGLSITDYTPGNVQLDEVEIQDKAVYNLFGEYYIQSSEDFAFYPSVLLVSDLTQMQTSVAVRAVYRDFLTLGAGVRGYSGNTLDAVMLLGGLRLSETMQLYYAYDLSLSVLSKVTEGSHELMLRYNLNKVIGAGLPPPVIYSPRF